MKAIINTNELSENQEIQKLQLANSLAAGEVKIVDYESNRKKGLFIISLYSQLFFEDSFKVAVHQNRLNIVISEFVEGNSPAFAAV